MKLIKKYGERLYFYCPGCKHAHCYDIPRWEWNGSYESPTFSPSLRVFYTEPKTKKMITVCHLWLKNGVISYCDDSPHDMKGKSVELPHFPEDYNI
jgi:hypothetical protein